MNNYEKKMLIKLEKFIKSVKLETYNIINKIIHQPYVFDKYDYLNNNSIEEEKYNLIIAAKGSMEYRISEYKRDITRLIQSNKELS
jgi:hypothetical protein